MISLDGKTVVDVHEWAADPVTLGTSVAAALLRQGARDLLCLQPTTHGQLARPNSAPQPARLADHGVADQSAVTSRCTTIVAIALSQETQRNSYQLVRSADPSRKRWWPSCPRR